MEKQLSLFTYALAARRNCPIAQGGEFARSVWEFSGLKLKFESDKRFEQYLPFY